MRQWVIMAANERGLTTTSEGGSNLTMSLTLMQDGYPASFRAWRALGDLDARVGGMKNHDVLRAATITGADAIGLAKDGTLEVGKLADLQVIDRNPLDDITNTNTIRYVMNNGRLYDGNTLDEMWPCVKPLATQRWWGEDPPPATTPSRRYSKRLSRRCRSRWTGYRRP